VVAFSAKPFGLLKPQSSAAARVAPREGGCVASDTFFRAHVNDALAH